MRSRRPSKLQAMTAFVSLTASFMRSFHSASTPSKRFESSGSWTRMSAEPMKIDCRFCHLPCTSRHVDSTTSTEPSFFCQFWTLSRKSALPCTYLDDWRFWSWRELSSRASMTVSSTASRKRSALSGSGGKDRFCTLHVSASFCSCFSMVSSFWARSTISSTSSSKRWSSRSSMPPKVNLSSILNVMPHARMSWFQWRSRMAGWWSSSTRGSDVCMFLTASSRPLKQGQFLTSLSHPLTSFCNFLFSSCNISTSISSQRVLRHSM
mmetsp:Transcript_33993/g.79402  ORF Transcript_33993/g.79402 Transcript_33993/m.79402 type:complete len:265 (+) Transcript_33993:148-942(+)